MPDQGFVSDSAEILYKFGLDKEKCLQRINQADDQYVQSINQVEERSNDSIQLSENANNSFRRLLENNSNRNNLNDIISTFRLNANSNSIDRRLNMEIILDRIRSSKIK